MLPSAATRRSALDAAKGISCGMVSRVMVHMQYRQMRFRDPLSTLDNLPDFELERRLKKQMRRLRGRAARLLPSCGGL